MNKAFIIILCALTIVFTACKKENGRASLSNGSISFENANGKDTIQMPVSILSDTTVVLELKAALAGNTSSTDHYISFAVDSSKIGDYREKYGDAVLLPSKSYFFYKPTALLPQGNSVSEAAQINIVQQTKLTEYTTYVLPLVIQSVDGIIEGPATSRVIFMVFKTGKPLHFNKSGWTIADYSSVLGAFAAKNVLDDNKTTTYWASSLTQPMPQWVTISFNREIAFTALQYSVPTILYYPTQGGYTTSIKIETSLDGTSWINRGVFPGDIKDNMQTINTGLITARYLRFTSLASVKYASTYSVIFISDISLLP